MDDVGDWINKLSEFRYGIQLGTASAGTFNLNCSFHGIPCIGYSNVNTQDILHPLTTIKVKSSNLNTVLFEYISRTELLPTSSKVMF